MLDRLREKHPDHRKLIVHIGAGAATFLIAAVYFYSVFTNKILANQNQVSKVETKSPAQELIKSLIFVGKEAGNVVKETIETSKTSKTTTKTSEEVPPNEYFDESSPASEQELPAPTPETEAYPVEPNTTVTPESQQ
ncbi:MAG TPA: hypothetical protein VGE63_02145 [Candidatus Paceibacterota bacterium]